MLSDVMVLLVLYYFEQGQFASQLLFDAKSEVIKSLIHQDGAKCSLLNCPSY